MFRVSAMSVDEANDEIARRCGAANPPNYMDYTFWVQNEMSMRAGDGIIYAAPFPLDSNTPDQFRDAYAASKDIYKRPFVGLDDQRLQGYIESTSYWANTIAIRADGRDVEYMRHSNPHIDTVHRGRTERRMG